METAFPRGGIKSHKKVNKVKDDDLFKVKQDKKVSKTKQKRNKRKKKQVEESTDDLVVVEPLSYKTLSTEMVILGCIETIKEYELKVILPGGSIGTVSIVNINNHYSNLLKSYTEDPKNVEDAVITLSGMFVVGQVVLCKVISTKYDAEKMKAEIKLSLDPKDVNGSLTHSCLYNGMILQAAVASIEDHGYVIDVGIEGVTSFLKYSNFTKNQDNQLVIGQLITCCIDIPKLSKGECIEDRTIILSLKTSLVDHSKVPENVNLTLHSLRPGMCLSAIVTDIQDNGLIVNCLDYKGCVYKDHLKSIWCKPSSYEIGQQVDGTVLYLHPISKHIYFSLHFNITPQKVKKMFGDYKIGSITEAKVTEIDKLIGVYFSIDDKIKALCTKKNLSDDDIENIGDKFLVGMTHKCRILGKNHIDKLLKISTKRSVVEKSYIPFEELKVGAIYKATVQKHVDNGMIVKLAHNVKGFIRKMDMSEICLNNPEKVFHPSSEVKCRILEIDDSKDPPSLLLTCKKTLVNSKLPILAKYEDAYPGMMVEGTIVLVKKTGLLVLFYNGVKGWITSRELSTEIIEYPEKVFHIGQVVKCCVLLCIPEQQIMKLTLKIEGKVPFGLKEMAKGNMFEVGNITDVKVSSVSDKGLDVIVLSHNIPAFLPVNHLSDNPANCKYLLHAYEIDEIIKDAVCFSTRGVLIVSKKSCFIQEAKSNKVAKQFSDFEEGIIVPAIVKGFATFGMFIETFNNVVGLVPLKRMLNEKVEEASKAGYVIHQSIMAKVITLDKTKERIVFSTKLNNCYLGNTEPSLDILENYLNEWMKIKEYYKKQTGMKKKLAKLEIGQVVNVTITEITDIGVLCKVQNDLPGVVIKEHLGAQNLIVGRLYESLILFIDLINDCIELSLDSRLIKGFKKTRDKESSKPRIKQIIKCEAILIKKFFILAALKGHAIGSLVYLPSLRHLNDLQGRDRNYTIRESYHAKIKRIQDNINIGILKQHDYDDDDDDDETQLENKSSENVQVSKINSNIDSNINDNSSKNSKKKRHIEMKEEESDKISKKAKKLNKDEHEKVEKIKRKKSNKTGEKESQENIRVIQDNINIGTLKQHDYDNDKCQLENKSSENVQVSKINSHVDSNINDKASENSKKRKHLQMKEEECDEISKQKKKKCNEDECEKTGKLKRKICNETEDAKEKESKENSLSVKEEEETISTEKSDEIKIERKKSKIESASCDEVEKEEKLQSENNCNLKVGNRYKAIIKSVKLFQLNILVNGNVPGRIHITEIADNVPEGINPLQSFKSNQELEVTFLGFRTCKSHNYLPISHVNSILRAECSLRSVRPKPFSIGQSITVFIKEFAKSHIKVWVRPEEIGRINLLNLTNVIKALKKPTNEYQLCQALRVKVYNITEDHIDLQKLGIDTLKEGKPTIGHVLSVRPDLGVFLHLPLGYRGTISLTDFKDEFKPLNSFMDWLMKQCFIRCQILHVDHETKQCVLSTRPSRLQGVPLESIVDREVESISDLSVGDYLRGYLVALSHKGIFVEIGRKIKGIIPKSNLPPDFIYSENHHPLGSVLKVQIVSIEDENIILDLLESISDGKTELPQIVHEESYEELKDRAQLSRLELPEGFVWDVDTHSSTVNIDKESDSDVEEKVVIKKEKQRTEREEEDYLYMRERQLMNNEREPTTVDDFDRLVLASPDNSMIWLKYMAFHLQQAEIEKAKAVGLRALKTISFREEQEKLNVWVALLNLEILYGTVESLKETFDKALQYNEPIKIYNHMVNLYVKSDKYNEAEDLYKTMVRKFKHDKDVHINFGLFFMKQNKIDAARNVLQRSLTVLENKEHVDVIAKFAQMEFKYGEAERGKTMFESILTNYRKRTDLWSLYIDLMKKHSTVDAVRNLFERVITLKLSARKMKFFFNRYLDFEKQFGNELTIDAVKQKAIQYVKSSNMSV